MAMQNIQQGKLLYHLTRLDNLESIILHGLVPRKVVKAHSVRFSDVADPMIITRRTELGLDEYVPFHFHPYSSFDTTLQEN